MGEIVQKRFNFNFKTILKSLLGGLGMGIVGFAYICLYSIERPVLGGFAQGVLVVLIGLLGLFNYNNIALAKSNNKDRLFAHIFVALVFLINVIGIVIMSLLLRLIFNFNQDFTLASELIARKRELGDLNPFSKTVVESFIVGFIAGLFIMLGAVIKRICPIKIIGYLAVAASVGLYVMLGFENILTNISYITYSLTWTWTKVAESIIVILGNVSGFYIIIYTFKIIMVQCFDKEL